MSAPWNQGGCGGENEKQIKKLLPTPTQAMGEHGPGSFRGRAAREAKTGMGLDEAVRLLPTPRRRDEKGPGFEDGLPNTMLRLLPTPRANEREGRAKTLSPAEASGHHGKPLMGEIVRLLPTPTVGDARNSRNATQNEGAGSKTGHSGRTLADVAWLWSGASTSPPSDAGSGSSALRLSPWFVEWMMGAPPGWSDPDCLLSATEFASRSASSSEQP